MAIRKIVARSIGVDVIVAEDIAANAITAAEISSGAVTTAKLATDLVVTHGLGSASTPSITFTGDTNTGIFSPTADTLAFAEGGVESMRIDSSGRLLVGSTNTLGTGAGGITSTVSSSYNLSLEKPTGGAIGFYQSGVNTSAIEDVSSQGGLRFYTGTSGTITEKVRIPAAGGLQVVNCVSVGNATPAASGAGVTFPATQSSSSDANTLDDYEEGTFTPSYTLDSGSVSGVSATGTYVKIGKTVTININIYFATATSASGFNLTGLPFIVENTVNYAVGAIRENANTGYMWQIRPGTNSTVALVRRYDNNASIASGMAFIGSVTYFTNT
jgi:hypothetical protein